jgi:hypothetical protein
VVDAVISPSGPKRWMIYEKPGDRRLGIIVQDGTIFTIHPYRDNFLSGVSLGPYSSKEKAMAAIAAKIGGNCSVGV